MPYSEEHADRAVKFFSLLTHAKGRWAGRSFELEPWQEKIVRDVFGTLRPDGTRQYRTVYVEVPRKQGKSTWAAGVALYLLFADNEPGAEVFSAAADREQAGIVFSIAAQMVRNSKALSKRSRVIDSTKRIVMPDAASVYKVLSAEAYTKHGLNAHGIIFDELHAQPNRELWDVLHTSTGAREQPLTVAITTAGYDRESICYELHEYAKKVRDGVVKDDSFYPVIFAADEDDAWDDEATWHKANPSLGRTVQVDFLRGEAEKAKHMPSYQNTFRRLYLNQWTQQENRWIDLALWDANAGMVVESDLKGRTCYGGLDLAAVKDLTAWVMAFPRDDDREELDILCRCWCPEAWAHDPRNRYRDSYQRWAGEGFLKLTPGDATDYSFVKKQILEDAEIFGLVDMNVDRLFQAHQLSVELMEELGEEWVIGMGQGFASMAAPMNEFERRLMARKIHHGGNPVMRFAADSLAVRTDPAGNRKPDKANSQARIDPIVALVMALARAMVHEQPKRSIYEDGGFAAL